MRFAQKFILFPVFAALTLMGASCASLSRSITPPRELDSFDYRNVTLDGGRLATQYKAVKDEYLAIPNEGLLKSFRQRAGLPAPGPDMGGWYEEGTFNIFGQILSGLARFYAGSGDPACKEKADYLIHEWAKCIAPDGYFFNNPHSRSSQYVYEKVMAGLLDNYVYCKNREALECLGRITDWAIARMTRDKTGWGASEWYTLGENLYRAYLVTADKKYLDYATIWEYSEYWDRFEQGVPTEDLFTNPPNVQGYKISFHAYSHVNTFSSAAGAYGATRDPRYLRIITNAYDYLQQQQVFATGGYGPMEYLMDRKGLIGSLDFPILHKHFETQCGSWAAFKLSKYLTRFTGMDRYGDWVERLVYNGIGASIPAGHGRVQYESDYHTGGAWKRNTDDPWTCCAGTRSEAIADCVDQVYFRNDESIFVNLFTPSTVRWGHEGTTITLRQRTRFPEENSTELMVMFPASAPEKSKRFGIGVRSPGWVAAPPSATLNGKPVKMHSLSTGWLMAERMWNDGDKLRVTFPMKLEWDAMDPAKPYPGAVRYGPVVLAVGAPGASPVEHIDASKLSASLQAIDGKPLHFRLASAPELTARPFYEFGEKERYFIYWDPKYAGIISLHDFEFDKEGQWQWGTSSKVGAWAECEFVAGNTVRLLGRHSKEGGRAEVRLDDKVAATIDQFKQNPDAKYSWEMTGLEPGKHILRVTILPDKDPESKGNSVNVGGLETR